MDTLDNEYQYPVHFPDDCRGFEVFVTHIGPGARRTFLPHPLFSTITNIVNTVFFPTYVLAIAIFKEMETILSRKHE